VRWSDGYIAGGIGSGSGRKLHDVPDESWKRAGRAGRPSFVCCAYFALGHLAEEDIRTYLGDYYGYLGPAVAAMVEATARTEDRVRATIHGFADVGGDKVILLSMDCRRRAPKIKGNGCPAALLDDSEEMVSSLERCQSQ